MKLTLREYHDMLVKAAGDGTFPSIKLESGWYGSIYRCRYRSADGGKCAAGLLIPDEEYHKEMEGEAVDCDKVWPVLSRYIPEEMTKEELLDVQGLHDGSVGQETGQWYQEAFLAGLKEIPCFKGFYPQMAKD